MPFYRRLIMYVVLEYWLLLLKVREKHMFSDVHPSSLDRRYYPKLKDIRWHAYAAARSLSLSQVDQVIIHFPLCVKTSLYVLQEPYGLDWWEF